MRNTLRKYETRLLAGITVFVLLFASVMYICTEHPTSKGSRKQNQLCWVEVNQNVATVHVEKGSGVRYVELVVGE